jgi:hypothetical protein
MVLSAEEKDIIDQEQGSAEPRRYRSCFDYDDRFRSRVRANDQGREVSGPIEGIISEPTQKIWCANRMLSRHNMAITGSLAYKAFTSMTFDLKPGFRG